LTRRLGRAYRDQVELSMAAAACLLMGRIISVIVERHPGQVREPLVGAR
jgi:hypothetical protein